MKEKRLTISIKREIFDALEKESRENYGVSRSKIIEEALRKHLKIKKGKWYQFWK